MHNQLFNQHAFYERMSLSNRISMKFYTNSGTTRSVSENGFCHLWAWHMSIQCRILKMLSVLGSCEHQARSTSKCNRRFEVAIDQDLQVCKSSLMVKLPN
ncbi:hypothetical protein Bealeia2_02057 (plasmid) [Candidatus Bealeia paramacronuclearis]|uniref:hypothetical protein n=1 Tax=Candidatus Bealeia paramacronuclearis TaxID=1921001 RepID=UPI002B76F072|nr:hypothetical protein [Candidatus Bealeia paramacronuclearis]